MWYYSKRNLLTYFKLSQNIFVEQICIDIENILVIHHLPPIVVDENWSKCFRISAMLTLYIQTKSSIDKFPVSIHNVHHIPHNGNGDLPSNILRHHVRILQCLLFIRGCVCVWVQKGNKLKAIWKWSHWILDNVCLSNDIL